MTTITTLHAKGNRCGHDPQAPSYYTPPESYKRPPSVIQYALNNLRGFYEAPKQLLKSIALTRHSLRRERSEAREADMQVLGVLIQHLDLVTMRFGMHQKEGGFISFDRRYIAKRLGWRDEQDEANDAKALKEGKKPSHRGIKRVGRVLERLYKAGYVISHPRCKVVKGEGGETLHVGLASVRCLSMRVFTDLGIDAQLVKKKRDEASKRLKKRLKAEAKEKEKQQLGLLQQMMKKMKQASPAFLKRPTYTPPSDEKIITQEKRRIEAYMLKKERPENKDLSPDDMYAKYPDLVPPIPQKE